MDCCRFGWARGGWEAQCAPAPGPHYAPYAHHYYAPHAHDPYARYNYRYDYAHHVPQTLEHGTNFDYGGYASKEVRARRGARRDSRARTPVQHLPLPPTPPLECGLTGRSAPYYDPQMWHHYQMGIMNGGWGGGMINNSSWPARPLPCREQMRYPGEYRSLKGPQMSGSHMYSPDGSSTPYSMYDDSPYTTDSSCVRRSHTADSGHVTEPSPTPLDRPPRPAPDPRPTPPPDKPPQVLVPLPAFQQAFGSTEIGKFAEAFSRTEIALEEMSNDTFSYESFSDWEAPSEPWTAPAQPTREIKCEDSF